jgi:hypothetical protein
LVGRDWAADASHPDIPLAVNAPPPEVEMMPEEQPADETADPDDPASPFRVDPNQPMAGIQSGAYGQQRGGYPGGGYPGGGYPGGGYEMGGRGGYMGEMMGPMPGMGGPMSQAGALPRGVDYWLLRFFDYTVQPGKKYKYRVKLVLADPNAGFPDNTLDPAVQDRLRANKRQGFREIAEWSEPSPTVGIPMPGNVYLAEAKLPSAKTLNDEPVVKLMVEMFDVDNTDGSPVHIAKEKDYRRGYIVNMKEKMEYAGGGDRWIDTFEDAYPINTGVTLLDISGGKELSRDYKAPTRALVMDPSGEMAIRKELDDSTTVEYLRMLFSHDKKRDGAEYMMPGPMMGPEFMRGAPR